MLPHLDFRTFLLACLNNVQTRVTIAPTKQVNIDRLGHFGSYVIMWEGLKRNVHENAADVGTKQVVLICHPLIKAPSDNHKYYMPIVRLMINYSY